MYCPTLSSATRESHRFSTTTLHNCPSCHCPPSHSQPSPPSLRISHIRSNPYLPNLHQSLYLSQPQNQNRKKGTNVFKSLIFGSNNNVTQSPRISPGRASITFSYSSPQKRIHVSCDNRLTTKTFKQKHFPKLKEREDEPMKKLVKDDKRNSCYYEIYTNEETPKQPKILKMNKIKSRQKLEVTLEPKISPKNSPNNSPKNSPKNSLKNSIRSSKVALSQKEPSLTNNPYNKSEPVPSFSNPSNQYGLQINIPTPINALWEMQFQQEKQKERNSSHRISQSQFIPFSKDPVQAPSIQYIRFNPTPTPTSSSKQLSNSQQIPSLASSKIVEYKPKNVVLSSGQNSSENTRMVTQLPLKSTKNAQINDSEPRIEIFKDRSINQSQEMDLKDISKDWELARSLSQELKLHYDYYEPYIGTDKSLSLNITL